MTLIALTKEIQTLSCSRVFSVLTRTNSSEDVLVQNFRCRHFLFESTHTLTHTLCLPAEQQWSHHINLRSASLRESQLSEVAALIQKQPHEIVKVIKIEGRRIFLGHFVLFQFRS